MESGRIIFVGNDGTLKNIAVDSNFKTFDAGENYKGKPMMNVVFTRAVQESLKKHMKTSGSRLLYPRTDSVNINDHTAHRMASTDKNKSRENMKTVDVRLWKR